MLAERDAGATTQSAPPPEPDNPADALPAEALRRLQQRLDRPGLVRLVGHFVAIFGTGGLYALCLARSAPALLSLLAAIAYGFTLVTMFAAMHESVHRTAFKTRWLNDTVGWVAGLLSFYNSTFYATTTAGITALRSYRAATRSWKTVSPRAWAPTCSS